MKVVRALALTALLSLGRQRAGAADDPLREVEIAEAHRTLVPSLVQNLDAAAPLAARSALAIGRTKDVAGRAPLRAHLTVDDVALRAMCAYGLGLLVDTESAPALRALARRDPNSAVRYAAVDALGRMASALPAAASRAAALDTLVVARSDADATVRAHAAAQLDAFGKQRSAAPQIVRLLQTIVNDDRDEDVRWHAAWAIFRGYATFADRDFLIRALHDRNELVRVEAARAWGRRSDPGATTILKAAAGDTSWRVQYEVREALKRTSHRPPTEHLTAVPAGIHLPPLPPSSPRASTSTSPSIDTATATATASGVSGGRVPPAAPDAAIVELAAPVLPTTAREMNAPALGPHPRVRIATTKGDVVVRLYREWAPSTVANFLALVERGYFNGNRWFRIVPDFVVQTGDPSDNGEGDAGYMIPAEENPIEQRTGIIAMGLNYDAKGAIRDSAGTQFYVTLSPQLHLDRDFSVFGEIESGFDVLANLIESDRMTFLTRISDG